MASRSTFYHDQCNIKQFYILLQSSVHNEIASIQPMHLIYDLGNGTRLNTLTHGDVNCVAPRWLDSVVLVWVMTAVVTLMWYVYINNAESHTRCMFLGGYRWSVHEELEFSFSIASWFRCCAFELDSFFLRNNGMCGVQGKCGHLQLTCKINQTMSYKEWNSSWNFL